MVFNDPAWDYRTADIDRLTKAADDKLASVLNAINPDLKKFKQHGGKMILYHGWSDAAIPAQNTIDYYQSLVHRMGAANVGQFARLYMVPGMQHCFAGAGPCLFGQLGVAQGDPKHNVAAALERWVEEGAAPEEIVAAKYKQPLDPASGLERSRPLCPYPAVAHYKGSGSTDDAENFECVAPGR
jgi:feruloyl esterase